MLTKVIEDFTDRSNSHLSEILVGTEIMDRKVTMDKRQPQKLKHIIKDTVIEKGQDLQIKFWEMI